MRDTKYATELATAAITFPAGDEARIERIHVKQNGEDEIRFSWWKGKQMMMRPLDLSEDDLLKLLKNALEAEVFTLQFKSKLREMLA